MATREDIFVRWEFSPRLIEVEAPSLTLTIQDLVDTLRILEDSWAGITQAHVLDASGKEDLGGGLFVGVTSKLRNARILFEPNEMVVSSETVTTASGNPIRRAITVIASGATFVADGVEPGYVVVNDTDLSHADVLNVDSETQLTVGMPIGGSLNDYQIGDAIRVISVDSAAIRGGNLVAVDDVNAPILATLPSGFTQVQLEKASASTIVIPDPFPVDVKSIRGSELAAILLGLAAQTMARGTITVVNSATEIEVQFDDGFDPEEGDGIAGRAILYTTGTNVRGGARISGVDGQGGGDPLLTLTYATTTQPLPTVGDTLILV